MLGKAKCKILKEIRQKIADENDIPYVTRECTYQGDCSGTCPRCESELRYLEKELETRRRLGRSVAVTALCAGITVGTTGCSVSSLPFIGNGGDLSGEAVPEEYELSGAEEYYTEEPYELEGDVAVEDYTEEYTDDWTELEGEEAVDPCGDGSDDCDTDDCDTDQCKDTDDGQHASPWNPGLEIDGTV